MLFGCVSKIRNITCASFGYLLLHKCFLLLGAHLCMFLLIYKIVLRVVASWKEQTSCESEIVGAKVG